jgi:hypothetical protein
MSTLAENFDQLIAWVEIRDGKTTIIFEDDSRLVVATGGAPCTPRSTWLH